MYIPVIELVLTSRVLGGIIHIGYRSDVFFERRLGARYARITHSTGNTGSPS